MSTDKQPPHWRVVVDEDAGIPAIQSRTAEDPFIIFSNQTSIGFNAARGWAETVCLWMNEQMRLGYAENKARLCDPILVVRLAGAEAKISALYAENSQLKEQLSHAQEVIRRARYEINKAIDKA